MNPEEGELRPQLLDRFGLCVDVAAPADLGERAEAVRRRLAFDRDPDGGDVARTPTRELAERLGRGPAGARSTTTCSTAASRLALAAGAEGLRADLTLCRAAAALAGLDGRARSRTSTTSAASPTSCSPTGPGGDPSTPRPSRPTSSPTRSTTPSAPPTRRDRRARRSRRPPTARRPTERPLTIGPGAGRPPCRGHRPSSSDRGRFVRAVPAADRPDAPVAALSTVRALAARRAGDPLGRARAPSDLRDRRTRPTRAPRLIVLCVDLSGSMGAPQRGRRGDGRRARPARRRLPAAPPRRPRRLRRRRRRRRARARRPASRSPATASRDLTTGGATPLAAGIRAALDVDRPRRAPPTAPLLVVLTDGRATGAPDALDQALDGGRRRPHRGHPRPRPGLRGRRRPPRPRRLPSPTALGARAAAPRRAGADDAARLIAASLTRTLTMMIARRRACSRRRRRAAGGVRQRRCGDAGTTSTPATTAARSRHGAARDHGSRNGEHGRRRAERIVSLSPSLTEMLYAIGAGDQVVAVDKYSDYPAGTPMTDLSRVQARTSRPSPGYDPDLVVVASDRDGIVAALDTRRHPDAAARAADRRRRHLRPAGTARRRHRPRRRRRADARRRHARPRSPSCAADVPEREAPLRYYYELSDDGHSATSETFIGSVLALAGLTSIADGVDDAAGGFPQLSREYVLDTDPDVIFLAHSDGTNPTTEELAARPGWNELAAVPAGWSSSSTPTSPAAGGPASSSCSPPPPPPPPGDRRQRGHPAARPPPSRPHPAPLVARGVHVHPRRDGCRPRPGPGLGPDHPGGPSPRSTTCRGWRSTTASAVPSPPSSPRSAFPASCWPPWSAPCWPAPAAGTRRRSATRWPTRTSSASPPAPGSASRSRSPTPAGRSARPACWPRSPRSPARSLAVGLTYGLGLDADRTRSTASLILAGVAVAALFSALQALLLQRDDEAIRDVYSWLLGPLQRRRLGPGAPAGAVRRRVDRRHRRGRPPARRARRSATTKPSPSASTLSPCVDS